MKIELVLLFLRRFAALRLSLIRIKYCLASFSCWQVCFSRKTCVSTRIHTHKSTEGHTIWAKKHFQIETYVTTSNYATINWYWAMWYVPTTNNVGGSKQKIKRMSIYWTKKNPVREIKWSLLELERNGIYYTVCVLQLPLLPPRTTRNKCE